MSDTPPPIPPVPPQAPPTPEVLPPLPPPPMGGASAPPPRSKDTVLSGFLFGLLLHLFQIPIGALTVGVGTLAIGLSQLLYMIPFYLSIKKTQPLRAKGLLICAAVTFLLNAACFGAFMVMLSGANFH